MARHYLQLDVLPWRDLDKGSRDKQLLCEGIIQLNTDIDCTENVFKLYIFPSRAITKTKPYLTTHEMANIPAFLTMGEIKKYGFSIEAKEPEPVRCPFCNKNLRFMGARSLYRRAIIKWKDKPELCDCEESLKLLANGVF